MRPKIRKGGCFQSHFRNEKAGKGPIRLMQCTSGILQVPLACTAGGTLFFWGGYIKLPFCVVLVGVGAIYLKEPRERAIFKYKKLPPTPSQLTERETESAFLDRRLLALCATGTAMRLSSRTSRRQDKALRKVFKLVTIPSKLMDHPEFTGYRHGKFAPFQIPDSSFQDCRSGPSR